MYVYKTTNLLSSKIYIGICYRKSNSENYYGSNKQLKKDIILLGEKNFLKEILEYSETKEDLFKKEIFYIKHFNSLSPNGYNLTTGGNSNFLHNSDTLDKIRKSATKQWSNPNKNTINGILKRVETRKMRNNFKHTEETKIKISESSLGRIQSDSTKEKISIGVKNSNRVLTTEGAKKISQVHKGKILSDETKLKISQKLKKYYESRNKTA